MAGLKEIRRRINSVKSTRQITKAMKLVSAAKLRRTQDAAIGGRAYSTRLERVLMIALRDLQGAFSHPLLEPREVTRHKRLIVISGERGLCGAFNSNLLKAVQVEISGAPEIKHEIIAIGSRAVSFGKRSGWNIVSSYESLPDDTSLWPVAEIVDELLYAYEGGKIDEAAIYFTRFASAISQVVTREPVLPFKIETRASMEQVVGRSELPMPGQTKYTPDAKGILLEVIPMLIRAQLRQAGMESRASEHAARMTAMDSATRNANDVIERLQLYYNRARQSVITKELIDIVGGAEAVK